MCNQLAINGARMVHIQASISVYTKCSIKVKTCQLRKVMAMAKLLINIKICCKKNGLQG